MLTSSRLTIFPHLSGSMFEVFSRLKFPMLFAK